MARTDHWKGALAVTLMAAALGASAAGVTHSDRRFLERASRDGIAEVALAKLAQQRAMRPEVRQFADEILADHEKANSDIAIFATARGVVPATRIDDDHQELMDELSKRVGPDFDREYMKRMVEDHEEDVEAFEDESRKGDDFELRQFAFRTLPALRRHLAMARKTGDVARSHASLQ
jgi:putative membrane protein